MKAFVENGVIFIVPKSDMVPKNCTLVLDIPENCSIHDVIFDGVSLRFKTEEEKTKEYTEVETKNVTHSPNYEDGLICCIVEDILSIVREKGILVNDDLRDEVYNILRQQLKKSISA